jgi:NDP-sugar pyrophosphorylase family protein
MTDDYWSNGPYKDPSGKPTAVILAAGKGTRMGILGENRAKAMINYKGNPLVCNVLDTLDGVVDKAVLVVGHRKEDVQELGTRYKNIELCYAEQPEPVGTTDASWRALPHVKGSFMLLFCDNIFEKPYLAECAKHEGSFIASWLTDPTNYGLCLPDYRGNIVSIKEKPARKDWKVFEGTGENSGRYLSFMGVAHMPRSFLSQLEPTPGQSIPDAIGAWAGTHTLAPVVMPDRAVQAVGTLKEFREAYRMHKVMTDQGEVFWDGSCWQMHKDGRLQDITMRHLEALRRHYDVPDGMLVHIGTAPWLLENHRVLTVTPTKEAPQ